MRRVRSLVLTSLALLTGFSALPALTAAPANAAYPCPPGHFCIYSDVNGGGTRCQWADSAKGNTADDCAFIQRGQNVRSVWNGTSHGVQYFTQTAYRHRAGATAARAGGNLQGNFQIRSFKPS
ncbi:peptidase inhibitor family I36 protein [Nocardia sp. NPDC060256]|uniref:peptidase inhibitor family I36 protein n=1 Tax=unclassified Nocardia TaxID=2637762 RepID=UPI00364881E5